MKTTLISVTVFLISISNLIAQTPEKYKPVFQAKPFVAELESITKRVKGDVASGKDTAMTGAKMTALFLAIKALEKEAEKQIFSDAVIPAQIDSFIKSPTQSNEYKGAGMGIIRSYYNPNSYQQLTMEVATDTTQFYSIRYYMNNGETLMKSSKEINIEPIKFADKYPGFIYRTTGYSFMQIMLDNAYVKFTTMDVKKGDKTINSLDAKGYKGVLKKFDADRLNTATSFK